MYSQPNTPLFLSFYFDIVVQYNSDTVDFWFFPVALTTWQECIAATFIWIVYKLDVASGCYHSPEYLCPSSLHGYPQADITVSDFMKGRCSSMIYAGIDIAKLNHYAAVISSDGIVLTEPFEFTNCVAYNKNTWIGNRIPQNRKRNSPKSERDTDPYQQHAGTP